MMRIILASDGLYYVMDGGWEFGGFSTYREAATWIEEQLERIL